jgi:hypothetical protein
MNKDRLVELCKRSARIGHNPRRERRRWRSWKDPFNSRYGTKIATPNEETVDKLLSSQCIMPCRNFHTVRAVRVAYRLSALRLDVDILGLWRWCYFKEARNWCDDENRKMRLQNQIEKQQAILLALMNNTHYIKCSWLFFFWLRQLIFGSCV